LSNCPSAFLLPSLGIFEESMKQFLLQDVVPGRYKIFAWQEVETAAIQDPQFRSLFERKAASLTLSESERETVQLRAISVGEVAEATGNHP